MNQKRKLEIGWNFQVPQRLKVSSLSDDLSDDYLSRVGDGLLIEVYRPSYPYVKLSFGRVEGIEVSIDDLQQVIRDILVKVAMNDWPKGGTP